MFSYSECLEHVVLPSSAVCLLQGLAGPLLLCGAAWLEWVPEFLLGRCNLHTEATVMSSPGAILRRAETAPPLPWASDRCDGQGIFFFEVAANSHVSLVRGSAGAFAALTAEGGTVKCWHMLRHVVARAR